MDSKGILPLRQLVWTDFREDAVIGFGSALYLARTYSYEELTEISLLLSRNQKTGHPSPSC